MRTAINVASIKDGMILLVFKVDVWILPGGKPIKNEGDLECLMREIGEELPEANVEIGECYGEFEGVIPHGGDTLRATVFLGTVDGDITPDEEISDARYFGKADLNGIPISDITTKIIASLSADKLF